MTNNIIKNTNLIISDLQNTPKICGGFFADDDAAAREALIAPKICGGFFADPARVLAVRIPRGRCPALIVPQDEAHLLAAMPPRPQPRTELYII